MIISQEPLVEIDSALFQNVSCMKMFCFFAIWHFKIFFSVGEWEAGGAARISKIFHLQRIRKVNFFFIKNPNLKSNKKKLAVRVEGLGVWLG